MLGVCHSLLVPTPCACCVLVSPVTGMVPPVLGVLNARADVDACSGRDLYEHARGLYEHYRESALKVDTGRKMP